MSQAHVYTSRHLMVLKLSPVVIDIVFIRFLGHCLLWPWPLTFWPQNLISTSTNSNMSVTKIGWNALYWFLRYGAQKVFGTHRLTHSLTHGQTQIQNASGTVFNGGVGTTSVTLWFGDHIAICSTAIALHIPLWRLVILILALSFQIVEQWVMCALR